MPNYIVLRYSPDAPPLWVLCDDDDVQSAVGRSVERITFLAERMEVDGTAVPRPLRMTDSTAWVVDGVDRLVGVTQDPMKAEAGAFACEHTYSAADFLVLADWPYTDPPDTEPPRGEEPSP